MLVSYAGVNLPKCSVEHRAILETRFRADSFRLWDRAELSARRDHWTFAGSKLNDRPITFDSIYWPTGAMRWAQAHFLVTETQLDQIREATTFGGSSTAATLSWGGEEDPLTAEMYMLPAVPISQVSADLPRRLYLLTLVDERYFWWYYKADIDIDEPCDETWPELFTAVGSALGITITTDGIESAYLKPCHELSNHNDPLPQQLDAMAYSVGQRIVRKLDGTVTSQGYANAKAANDELAAHTDWNRTSGHLFALPSGNAAEAQPGDVSLMVPAAVVVSFPRRCSGWYDKEVSLASLALVGFTGVEGFIGQKCFHDTAVASGTGTPTNQAQLDALATLHATDWYRWQTGRVAAVYSCLRDVTPHGLIDSVEWVNDDTGIYTVVRRPPFDDKAEELLHCGSAGCSPDCPKEICGRAEVKALTEGCIEGDPSGGRGSHLDWATTCTIRAYPPSLPSQNWSYGNADRIGWGRAEIKALTGGCIDAEVDSWSLRKNSTGTVYTRQQLNLIEGSGITITVADDSTTPEVDVTIAATGATGIQILVKAYDDSAQVVTAGTDAYLDLDSEEGDTHTFRPGDDNKEITFASGGTGWYLVSISAEADVTFSSAQVTPEEVKLEGHLNGTVVRGLANCKYIQKAATPEDGTGTGTLSHEIDHVCLEATHLMNVTDTAHRFKVKGFASASLDTTFSAVVVSIVKVNRTGLVAA